MCMSSKKDYSNKILRILGKKPAVSVEELANSITIPYPLLNNEGRKNSYAITRSLKGLRDAGLIEQIPSAQNEYARLTKEGKKKMHSLSLDNEKNLVNTCWDGL